MLSVVLVLLFITCGRNEDNPFVASPHDDLADASVDNRFQAHVTHVTAVEEMGECIW